jgi:predicted nucleotidyltransferase
MHPKYAESVRQIKNYAENESNVMGVILLGSQVRKEVPGDQWSDLDVLLFLQDTSRHTTTDEWLSVFGEVACICHERVELPWRT